MDRGDEFMYICDFLLKEVLYRLSICNDQD